jgi:hypothetical protein
VARIWDCLQLFGRVWTVVGFEGEGEAAAEREALQNVKGSDRSFVGFRVNIAQHSREQQDRDNNIK